MDNTELKRKALERFFARSNNMQKKAIFRTEGAVLIIAGAGSGKTTVLCNRIANLLLFGDAPAGGVQVHADAFLLEVGLERLVCVICLLLGLHLVADGVLVLYGLERTLPALG